MFAAFRLPGGACPGDALVSGTADERCWGLQDGYAMDGWAVPRDVDVYATPACGCEPGGVRRAYTGEKVPG